MHLRRRSPDFIQNRYLIPLSFTINTWAYFRTDWPLEVSPFSVDFVFQRQNLNELNYVITSVVSDKIIFALSSLDTYGYYRCKHFSRYEGVMFMIGITVVEMMMFLR